MIQDHQLSERHACRLVGLSRDSYRNPPQPDQLTRDLCERIVDIAHVRRRFGYRRIHDLLRPEFPHVNHKRVYRLYRDANLAVRRRKKAKRPLNERVSLQLAQTVNEVWTTPEGACQPPSRMSITAQGLSTYNVACKAKYTKREAIRPTHGVDCAKFLAACARSGPAHLAASQMASQ